MSGLMTAGTAIDSSASSAKDNVRRRIYLAGPFTQHLVLSDSPSDAPAATGTTASGGVISPESVWRRTLLATSSALERLGWEVFLPHRDVSAWGERDISPGSVARECLEAVVRSDVVVAVMGESFGTHVEVGAALASGIPVVVVRSSSSLESFFACAVAESPWVGELSCSALEELPRVVQSNVFESALEKARAASMDLRKSQAGFGSFWLKGGNGSCRAARRKRTHRLFTRFRLLAGMGSVSGDRTIRGERRR
jgi:nucleoside 2-deoxyribosyltransferase